MGITLESTILLAGAVALFIAAVYIRDWYKEKKMQEQAARVVKRKTEQLADDVLERFGDPMCEESVPGWKMDAMKPEEIFALENRRDLVAQMIVSLAQKCDYGEGISVLTEAEQTVYLAILMEAEVHNGGFEQYFYNSSGNHANKVAGALKKLNALQLAGICERALAIFGDSVPENWDQRNEVFDELLQDDPRVLEVILECNYTFFECEENLTDLCYEYIMKHKDQFS